MAATLLEQRDSSSPARVRLIDVARAVGLTKGTVSRALNDHPDIAETTRLRVRRTAQRLGYRPLAHAQAIRTGRVRSIGLVLQINEHDGHRPFLADFLAGVSQAASGEDWTMTVATAATEADTLRLLSTLWEDRKADGFILPRTYVEDARITTLRDMRVPFVLYGRTGDDTGCAWFDIDSEAAMAEAVSRLRALGHDRIGFVPGGEGPMYARLRWQGFCEGMAREGLPVDPGLVGLPALDRAAGAAATRGLLARDDAPTAVIFAVDQAALGAYDVARDRGLRIGRDLSVVSYDGIPEGALMDPPLSTWAVDTRAAGARLADMLIARARGTPPEDLRALGHATFLSRGSEGPAPGRADAP
ncbi:LacI family DNA-binding transcriptional regulator [Roseisalinus antarcticus]|uniref:HTH-type transcriptional regulator RafR n=1 Tax=Roseisalinus antarcticus TaxID=254357 RepID=A0A1Y5RGJ2_9RHOB|nr:substrate-binding domain-containing protein [Roseisalinus antarcticus]SLN14164.1 HTH-type transcriptional regulator RafR [Roseisalinus antarcticus]